MPAKTVGSVVTALLLAFSMPALAQDYDPDLGAFFICPDRAANCASGAVAPDMDGFRDYATQIAAALAPRFPGPAGSLGGNGWEVALITGFNKVDADQAYWTGKAESGQFLTMNQIRVRKGLPYSVSLQGSVSHLYDSGLWGIGLGVGWAAVEGFQNAPEISFVADVGTVLGTQDFLMVHLHAAVVISKAFSVAGLFQLAPYTGYDLMYVNASTHLTTTYAAGAATPTVLAIDPTNILRHRLFLGLDAIITYGVLGLEMNVDVQSARLAWAFKAGVQF